MQWGQTLFTIDSPDLLQAESTLIAAAGVLEFTTRNLARLRELYKTRAVSQKDMEQAASDQQTAEGALRAARDSVRLFGKSDAEIDRIIAERKADPILAPRFQPIFGPTESHFGAVRAFFWVYGTAQDAFVRFA